MKYARQDISNTTVEILTAITDQDQNPPEGGTLRHRSGLNGHYYCDLQGIQKSLTYQLTSHPLTHGGPSCECYPNETKH
ncbi:hypothetical protein AVEN_11281-1 [Araneus ventricosus]|uniref:Uncharacterized protein n=1 Tax=Araneus ventricosus TaxID=182803 RepID=A0A4Y2QJ60_ARAVE|nr:hypothetical protein AVEN_11281-1 [Araneus ventricosus]